MSANSETLYVKIDQNIVVKKPSVTLNDIAKLTCTNTAALRQLKQMKVYTFHSVDKIKNSTKNKNKKQIQVFSILKIIELINQEYPNMDIQSMGEDDFVLEYDPKEKNKFVMYVKTGLLCIVIFFGSAFAIMTFNNDVGVLDVFSKFYEQVMGVKSDGFTALEICYSIGLSLGVLIFFNHVGRKKITHDPTPIQVQMRIYEQDVDTTFIENCGRKGSNIDVD
ncbi:stage V sporulation protein AA [Lachnospiraceae bacterium ZAX-1]